MSKFDAESAAWKLTAIAREIAAEARAIALDVASGMSVAHRVAFLRKQIADAETAMAVLTAELDAHQIAGTSNG